MDLYSGAEDVYQARKGNETEYRFSLNSPMSGYVPWVLHRDPIGPVLTNRRLIPQSILDGFYGQKSVQPTFNTATKGHRPLLRPLLEVVWPPFTGRGELSELGSSRRKTPTRGRGVRRDRNSPQFFPSGPGVPSHLGAHPTSTPRPRGNQKDSECHVGGPPLPTQEDY